MPYLLDANTFIRAGNMEYRFSVCPGFWDWLEIAHAAGDVFSIDHVLRELLAKEDKLAEWARLRPSDFFLPTGPAVEPSLTAVSRWVQRHPHYQPHAVATFLSRCDYFLVSQAHHRGFTVVTHEIPQPASLARVKIPDACRAMGVPWVNPYDMLEQAGARFDLRSR